MNVELREVSEMSDDAIASELERLHKELHDGQELRLRNQERPEDSNVKWHWDTWDRMFELFKEEWSRKGRSEPSPLNLP